MGYYDQILTFVNNSVYGLQAAGVLYGLFCAIVVVRSIAQKRFRTQEAAREFQEAVSEELRNRNFDSIQEICDSPPYWSKAVPQLIQVALANRKRSSSKIRRIVAERFEQDVLGELESRVSWINLMIKIEPMLGLLGTVMGMIQAFAKIAASTGGTDPNVLADDISFALITTAVGLFAAIPLMLIVSLLNGRIGALQEQTQEGISVFLDDLDEVTQGGRNI